MNAPYELDSNLEERLSRKLLDVFIRAGIVFGLALLSYRIFAPFLALVAWSIILAVTLYPAHQKLAQRMAGKQGLAATLLVLVAIVVIGVPTAILMTSLGESLQNAVASVRAGTLKVPAPSPNVASICAPSHAWLITIWLMPAARRRRKCQPISGSPPASNNGLGVRSVSGRIRSPRPAASIMAFIVFPMG